jgi:23S rRNA pseudouridine1911/1915/1917 synthase
MFRNFAVMIDVLWEDNHLIIVNKPAGVPTQGDETGDAHLLGMTEEYIRVKYNKPGAAYVGLVHRIDRPVSGAVILAKTSKALVRMNEIFQKKENRKIYHAIVSTQLPEESGTLEHFLGKDSVTHKALAYNKPRGGAKLSILHYRLLASLAGKYLYEIHLETGRFHQIRAQLSKVGSPILGDLKYGAGNPLPDRSIALHSRQLITPHPVKTNPSVSVTAPYPKKQWWDLFKEESRGTKKRR